MSAVPATVDKRRILVVDDIELNRVLTEAVLRGATYEVDTVEDGAAAIAALATNSYDLVLMDLEMPGVDGHTTAATIRRERRDPVKIAALSAKGHGADREKSRASGMAAHIARPIAPHELLREIERVFCQPETEAWDKACYDDWLERLGTDRMRGVLAKLLDQFRALQVLLDEADTDAVAVHHAAHDLASTAGMLGFLDVMRCCRSVQKMPEAIDAKACPALAGALQRAIVALEDYTDSQTMIGAVA